MGKLLSRAAAAKMLGCTPQTITNYVRYGLIDELHRKMNGRDGFYYDSDQLAALAPRLTEVSELEARIQQKKDALMDEERAVDQARENARQEFIRFSGGKKTWRKYQELIVGAYVFAGKVTPSWASYFEVQVLERVLALEDFDTICATLKTTPFKVNTAISRIAKRMLKMKDMETRLQEVTLDVDRVFADNRRLQQANELLEAMQDVPMMTSSSGLSSEVQELARMLYPLKKMYIASLHFSTRAETVLRELGVHTIFELVGTKEEVLRSARGMGEKTLEEIKQRLKGMGLTLGMHQIGRSGLAFDYLRSESIYDAH